MKNNNDNEKNGPTRMSNQVASCRQRFCYYFLVDVLVVISLLTGRKKRRLGTFQRLFGYGIEEEEGEEERRKEISKKIREEEKEEEEEEG